MRSIIILLLLASILFLGCAGTEKVEKSTTPASTPSTNTTPVPSESPAPSESDPELQEAINEIQEVEELINELQQLESLDFEI